MTESTTNPAPTQADALMETEEQAVFSYGKASECTKSAGFGAYRDMFGWPNPIPGQ